MNFKDIVNDTPLHIKKEFIYRKHEKGSLIIHPHEEGGHARGGHRSRSKRRTAKMNSRINCCLQSSLNLPPLSTILD